jgi:hypothetical protein
MMASRPPAGEEGHERQGPDHRLVEARRVRVDDVEVSVRVGRAGLLHLGKLTLIRGIKPITVRET